mgnify:CR=1 FL=1
MGRVYGRAGGSASVGGSFESFSGAGKVGARGERRTGEVLNALASRPDGPTVFHDLVIPGVPGPNVDHAVVAGKKVLLLDSKFYAPGFYWTFGGVTRRKFEAVPFADKATLPMAFDRFAPLLGRAKMLRPVMVVWPSRADEKMSLSLFRPQGARALAGERLESFISRRMFSPASSEVVALLQEFVR